jgi:hypothetical protein
MEERQLKVFLAVIGTPHHCLSADLNNIAALRHENLELKHGRNCHHQQEGRCFPSR